MVFYFDRGRQEQPQSQQQPYQQDHQHIMQQQQNLSAAVPPMNNTATSLQHSSSQGLTESQMMAATLAGSALGRGGPVRLGSSHVKLNESSVAPIPRTIPLQSVREQLSSSSGSSPNSSPKHHKSLPHSGLGLSGQSVSTVAAQSNQLHYTQQQIHAQQIKRMDLGECWSPVSELSPIQDVSPSIEAAEQRSMQTAQAVVAAAQQITQLKFNDDVSI